MTKIDASTQKASKKDGIRWNSKVIHPMQTWEWGEFRKAMGIDVVRITWRSPEPAEGSRPEPAEGSRPEPAEGSRPEPAEGSRPEPAEGQLTFHHIPLTPWTIGYFPKGPAPTKDMIAELTRLGNLKNSIFIQLEPNVENNDKTIKQYNNLSLRPSHHPLFTKYTFILDLTRSEDELLRAMHSKTRYNLKVAQKHNVIVKEDNSKKAFDEYLRLNRETTDRQGFYAHNSDYHQTMWKILHDAGIAHLFTATYQGKTLAAWIIFTWNDTLFYPYGTSSREHRDVMAPTLLLWEIARWGKRKGYAKFDLWGALGPDPNPHDPWFGFHRFKQGFNPQLVEYAGSYDLVTRPFLYKLYTIADALRWFILKRKTKS